MMRDCDQRASYGVNIFIKRLVCQVAVFSLSGSSFTAGQELVS